MSPELFRRVRALAHLRRVERWTRELRAACHIVGLRFELRISDDRTGGAFVADMAGSRVEYEPIRITIERTDP